jgi:hypothetical protein
MTIRGTKGGGDSALWQEGEDVLVRVYAKPRASKSRIVKTSNAELHVALSAPPVDGEANKELLKLISRSFGFPKSALTVEKGEASRHKVVRVRGGDVEKIEMTLDAMIFD